MLLYRLEDKRIQSYFLGGRYPKREELRALADAMTGPAGVEALANASQLGKRRTQVLLQIMLDAKAVKRTKAGFVLLSPMREEELDYLLNETLARAARGKERLSEMMRYAETVGCTTQVLRAYFGEAAGDPCGRCDNCERGLETADADLHEAQPEKRRRKKGVSLPEAVSAGGGSAQAVTVVQTPYGEIWTTAPETLPGAPDEGALAIGDRVRHKRFGLGRVRDLHGDNALVHFAKAGDKRIALSFLRKA